MEKKVQQVYRVEWFEEEKSIYSQEYYLNVMEAAARLVALESRGCTPMLETIPLM